MISGPIPLRMKRSGLGQKREVAIFNPKSAPKSYSVNIHYWRKNYDHTTTQSIHE
jgi:hypothetical protein